MSMTGKALFSETGNSTSALELDVSSQLRESIMLLGAKRTMLRRERDGIDTIVVGSSHGDYAFDPKFCPGAFNLCCKSQDLKHSYGIYRSVAQELPGIRHVVVFYSVFSPGFYLEKVYSERDICLAINEVFGTGFAYEDEYLVQTAALIKDRLDSFGIALEGHSGFLPTSGKFFFPASHGAERRANDHMKLNVSDAANLYLLKILMLARQLGHKVTIVMPPVRSDYRAAVGRDFQHVFRGVLEIAQEFSAAYAFDVLGLYADAAFPDEHFGDYDHLLPTGIGPGILTARIAGALGKA